MAGISGPGIIDDGLIFYVDAKNTKSYPGSGTDWNDLMGDTNLTGLVGGSGEPTFNTLAGGCFDFDGSDALQFGHTAGGFDFADFAVECWIYFDNIGQEGSATVWFNTSSNGVLQFAIEGTGDNPNVGIYAGGWSGWVSTSGLTDLQNRWSCHTATRIGSTITQYIDGVSRDTLTSSTAGNDNSALLFGEQAGGNHSLDGKIANIKIYNNKGLTSTEVLQNYNAHKSRFGL